MKKVNDGLGFLYSLESKNEIVFGNASVIGKFCSFLFTLLLLDFCERVSNQRRCECYNSSILASIA